MRLLIADDDDYTREGLAEIMDWKQYGIEEILLAGDGAEALRLTVQKKPEIILTDIRMPKLSGIEFAERLAEKSPDSLLLFMSGFMEVEYLKSAIKLSAVEYIEKPIKLPEVEQAIRKSIGYVQKRQTQQAMEMRKNELEKQRLAGMLREGRTGVDVILNLCRETGFPGDQNYVGMIVWNAGESADVDGSAAAQADLELLLRYWRDYEYAAIGEQLDRNRCFLILACGRCEEKRLAYLIDVFLQNHAEYRMAIGKTAVWLSEISDGFKSAERAMERSFYHADLRCYHDQAETGLTDDSFAQLLPEFYKLAADSPREVPAWIRRVCGLLWETEPAKDKVLALFESVLLGMIGVCPMLRTTLGSEYGAADAKSVLRDCPSLACLESRLASLASAWLNELDQAAGYSRLVQDVIKYIALHYRNADLDLPMIGNQMHMSSAHLGMLFKQETGVTIKQYLSDYRLEAAKKLVASEHLHMNEIAGMCGYASASYFAKVFKTATGMSPLEYRHAGKQPAS